MAVDEFLITTPHYYRPETREGEISNRGSGVRGSAVRGASTGRGKGLAES